jgi:hypothetical protein
VTQPQSHRQAFTSILLDHLGLETYLVQEIIGRLSPLFDIIENNDVYPLEDGDRFDPEALVSQMRELTGRTGLRTVKILSRGVLLQEDARPRFFPLYSETCFTQPLTENRSIPTKSASILFTAIQEHVMAGITDAMHRGMNRRSEPVETVHETVAAAMQNVRQLVLNYCWAALAADRERMELLDMPLAFVANLIPLGVRTSDRETFFYLGA